MSNGTKIVKLDDEGHKSLQEALVKAPSGRSGRFNDIKNAVCSTYARGTFVTAPQVKNAVLKGFKDKLQKIADEADVSVGTKTASIVYSILNGKSIFKKETVNGKVVYKRV